MKLAFLLIMFLVGCATTKNRDNTGEQTPTSGDLGVDLKVTSTVGKLKAKLEFTNRSNHDVDVSGLEARYFRIETVDGKAMEFRGKSAPGEVLHIAPTATAESSFILQDSYPFWDRRTKYKIWYESPSLKSNTVQVWF
jgi:hypothetical protein